MASHDMRSRATQRRQRQATSRRAPSLRLWSRRIGSARLAQEAEGRCRYCSRLRSKNPTVYIDSISAQGTPGLPEPDLNSSAIDLTSQHYAGGTLTVMISELNQFPLTGFNSFESVFSSTSPQGAFAGFGTFTSLTEQTYVTTCANPVSGGCPANDAFAMGNLLSTTTFTSAGTSVTKLAGIPIDLSAPYVTTLVYTIVMPGDAYKDADASIDLSTSLLSPPGGSAAAPLPAALPLFATGLGGLGLLGWHRKRRAQAVA